MGHPPLLFFEQEQSYGFAFAIEFDSIIASLVLLC
jgi:hypothetical protein